MDERIVNAFKHPATIPTITGMAGFAIGVGVGRYITFRKKEVEADASPEQLEIDYTDRYPDSPTSTFVVSEDYIKQLDEYRSDLAESPKVVYVKQEVDWEPPEDVVADIVEAQQRSNIFASTGEGWDYELEKLARGEMALEGIPYYIIHADEFHQNESGFDQMSLVYYAGDDTMVDDRDQPVLDYVRHMGELEFGHGSNDPNVVYIRNTARKAEYEILKHTGTYSEEVLGMELEEKERVREIKHSAVRRLRPEE